MNIALLTTEYAHEKTPRSGGIGTFFSILAKGLRKKGHKVYVIVFTGKKEFDFIDNDVKVFVKKDFFKKYLFSDLLRSITKNKPKFKKHYQNTYIKERKYIARVFEEVIKNKKIDIIETQDYGGISMYVNNAVPVVIRTHGTNTVLVEEFGYKKPKLYNEVFNYLEKKVIADKKNHIVAISKYAARLINKFFDRSDVTVIYNGIDIEKFKSKNKDNRIEKSIFYVGTLSEKKGVDVLCTVFNKVKTSFGMASLHLIGSGKEYFDYLKKNVLDAQVLNDVKYYGKVNYSNIEDILQQATLFVFPTKGETFGFVFLESMAMQSPIIVNNIDVSSEIITHKKSGFIANNINDYVKYITQLFTNSTLYDEIAVNGRKRVEIKFSNKKMVENTIAFYKSILQ